MTDRVFQRQRDFLLRAREADRYLARCPGCGAEHPALDGPAALQFVTEHTGHAGVWVERAKLAKAKRTAAAR